MSIVDKAQLKVLLYERQRLYHQMVNDKITGPTLEKVQKDIQDILKKLYRQVNPKQLL